MEDLGLFFGSLVTGDVLRAYHLERKCYRGRQHQQCVDGRCVRESSRSQKPRGNDVVEQVGNAYQPRSRQQGDTSTEKFLPQSPAVRGGGCGFHIERESSPKFGEKDHRVSDAAALEQCQMHNREHGVSGRTGEIVETLLLDPNRKADRK